MDGTRTSRVLNAAYLVASDDTSLIAAVGELDAAYRRLAISFELTGPWPPYNFVEGVEDGE